jgi:hypothetical protein
MRPNTAVLIHVILLAGLLLATPAVADTDVTVRVDAGQGGSSYDYGWQWFWGDPVLGGALDYSRNGLHLGVGANGRRAGFDPYYPFGTHPNDRGGYRLFIPRGLQYPPQYYGDPPGSNPTLPGWTRPHHTPYTNHYTYPLAIPYTYGYNCYGNPSVLYTAPSYHELGYYRQYPNDYQPPVNNNYDNRVYNNYYYGDQAPAPAPAQTPLPPRYAPPVAPQPSAPAAPATPAPPPPEFSGPVKPASPPVPADVPVIPAGRSYGVRFYEQTRLSTPDGDLRCTLKDGKLTGADAAGQGYAISTAADMAFGAFAAYDPVSGLCVIFREGDSLLAAYPTGGGEWWTEPLPYKVDFSAELSIGMIGGQPWVTFSMADGRRYVVSFGGRNWQEVGSGSRPVKK